MTGHIPLASEGGCVSQLCAQMAVAVRCTTACMHGLLHRVAHALLPRPCMQGREAVVVKLLEQSGGLDQLLFCVNNYKNRDPVRSPHACMHACTEGPTCIERFGAAASWQPGAAVRCACRKQPATQCFACCVHSSAAGSSHTRQQRLRAALGSMGWWSSLCRALMCAPGMCCVAAGAGRRGGVPAGLLRRAVQLPAGARVQVHLRQGELLSLTMQGAGAG